MNISDSVCVVLYRGGECVVVWRCYLHWYDLFLVIFFFFKQKTAYEIVDCDWSSDVCSSDLGGAQPYKTCHSGLPPEVREEVGRCQLAAFHQGLADRKSVV